MRVNDRVRSKVSFWHFQSLFHVPKGSVGTVLEVHPKDENYLRVEFLQDTLWVRVDDVQLEESDDE